MNEKEMSEEEIRERVKELLIKRGQREAMEFLASIGRYDDANDLTHQENWFYYLGEDGLKEMVKREWEKHTMSLRVLSYEVAGFTGWGVYYSLCWLVKYLSSLNYKITRSKLRYVFKFAIQGEIPEELKDEAWKCLVKLVKE